jgi:hypothetical protein
MKALLVAAVLYLTAFSLAAASFTLDNNIRPTGQYTSWNAAYSAAADGDTIYVYPSPYDYGSFNVAKRLTVVGGGFNPANPGLITSRISLWVSSASGEDCLFSGLDIPNGVNCSYRVKYTNCLFNSWISLAASNSELSFCWLKHNANVGAGSAPTNGFLITGCTFEGGSFKPASQTDATCSNCVFMGNVAHIDTFINNQIACYFLNCLFVNSGTGNHTLAGVYSSPVSLSFVNCIMEAIDGLAAAFTYQYCIFEGSSANISGPGNQQSVNLANVMEDVNGGDYHLVTGSLASGAGLNGEDIGIYGGDTPFNDLWYLTRLPSITDFDCPAVVDTNGQLNVHIEAQCGN